MILVLLPFLSIIHLITAEDYKCHENFPAVKKGEFCERMRREQTIEKLEKYINSAEGCCTEKGIESAKERLNKEKERRKIAAHKRRFDESCKKITDAQTYENFLKFKKEAKEKNHNPERCPKYSEKKKEWDDGRKHWCDEDNYLEEDQHFFSEENKINVERFCDDEEIRSFERRKRVLDRICREVENITNLDLERIKKLGNKEKYSKCHNYYAVALAFNELNEHEECRYKRDSFIDEMKKMTKFDRWHYDELVQELKKCSENSEIKKILGDSERYIKKYIDNKETLSLEINIEFLKVPNYKEEKGMWPLNTKQPKAYIKIECWGDKCNTKNIDSINKKLEKKASENQTISIGTITIEWNPNTQYTIKVMDKYRIGSDEKLAEIDLETDQLCGYKGFDIGRKSVKPEGNELDAGFITIDMKLRKIEDICPW